MNLAQNIAEVETLLEELIKCRDPGRAFKLFTATWNVGNRAPTLKDLVRSMHVFSGDLINAVL